MKVREHKIESLTEYIKICQGLPKQLFRGECDASRELIPSLFRHKFHNDGNFHKWRGIEHDLLLKFKRFGSRYLKDVDDDILELIAQSRHYGLPSRFIDWSSNPLVALYFSVIDNYIDDDMKDGVVWFLAGQSWMPDSLKLKSLSDLRDWFAKRYNYDIIVYTPKLNNPRIIAQSGCFTIHRVPSQNIEVSSVFDTEFSPSGGQSLEKIIIPGNKKHQLRVELDRLGINHFRLFPDGDGLATSIKWDIFLESKNRTYNEQNLDSCEI